jgi:hypothetical protein
MSGIKHSAQRPKASKHLKSATVKKFRQSDDETLGNYLRKIQARRDRKAKKKSRRK